jgi:hypothetical protein
MNKKAAIGESLNMVIRIFIIAFIALIVFGTSAIVYKYYLDVTNAEAMIMQRDVILCLAPNGVFDWDNFNATVKNKETFLSDYCKLKNTERFFVNAEVIFYNAANSEAIISFQQGDTSLKTFRQRYPADRVEITAWQVGKAYGYLAVSLLLDRYTFVGGKILRSAVDKELQIGSEGALRILQEKVTKSVKMPMAKLRTYKPGYYSSGVPILVIRNGKIEEAYLAIETLVQSAGD